MPSNKEIGWSYFELFNQGRIEEALALLDDAGSWWNTLNRKTTTMQKMKAATRQIAPLVPFKFTLHHALQDGDMVALDLESHATLPNGKVYNNVYAYIFTIRNGKILHCREHADTKHAAEVLPADAFALDVASYE
jgi:ketosteroid isomerase-like protein